MNEHKIKTLWENINFETKSLTRYFIYYYYLLLLLLFLYLSV